MLYTALSGMNQIAGWILDPVTGFSLRCSI